MKAWTIGGDSNVIKCSSALAHALAFALIASSSLFRGGNRHVALVGLEWLALGLLTLGALASLLSGRLPAGWGGKGVVRWALVGLAFAPLVLALLQGLGPINLAPAARWATALAGLPIVAMLVAGLGATSTQTNALWRAWLWVALAQAVLGFLQLGGLERLRFEIPSGEKLIGSFASKNTYSNFMVMAVPLVIYGLLAPTSAGRKGHKPWLWGAGLFVLLTAISLGKSRTGIATGLLTVLLSVAFLVPAREVESPGAHRGLKRRWVWMSAATLLGAVALAGGLDWIERFSGPQLAEADAIRGLMREASWQGVIAYWPWGSGLGSYRWIFPAFQPPELGLYLIDLAHNDYLQLLMELGIGFLAIALLVLAMVTQRIWALWRSSRKRWGISWTDADRLAVACGLGALATALHALVDYPLHIPANAMFAAFLLGVFLRAPDGERI